MEKYAVISKAELTDSHIQLIRVTGVNSYAHSLTTTPQSYPGDPLVIVEWNHDIAQQIPEAMQEIQRIIDAGIPIFDEFEMRDYLDDENCPFNFGDIDDA